MKQMAERIWAYLQEYGYIDLGSHDAPGDGGQLDKLAAFLADPAHVQPRDELFEAVDAAMRGPQARQARWTETRKLETLARRVADAWNRSGPVVSEELCVAVEELRVAVNE